MLSCLHYRRVYPNFKSSRYRYRYYCGCRKYACPLRIAWTSVGEPIFLLIYSFTHFCSYPSWYRMSSATSEKYFEVPSISVHIRAPMRPPLEAKRATWYQLRFLFYLLCVAMKGAVRVVLQIMTILHLSLRTLFNIRRTMNASAPEAVFFSRRTRRSLFT